MMRILGGAAFLLLATAFAQAQDTSALTSDLHWRQLGPFRGGWATAVEGIPAKPDTFYFGAAGGGIWKTDDAGQTWQPLFQNGPAASIGALAVASSNPNTIYIGTGQPEPRYDIGAGLGVFKSTDGGAHWTSLGLANTRYIGRIWVDPKNENVVLVGAQGHFFGPSADRGLYRSTDGGKTWSQVLKIDDWTGVVDIASDPTNPKLIFASAWEAHQYPWQSYFTPVAGLGSAIYKSADGGVTWKKLSGNGWPTAPLGRIGLGVAHIGKATRIYAAVDSKEAGGLYRSDDGGIHWARVNDSTDFTNWYASRLTVAPNDPDVVYTVGQSIRRCTQGGKTLRNHQRRAGRRRLPSYLDQPASSRSHDPGLGPGRDRQREWRGYVEQLVQSAHRDNSIISRPTTGFPIGSIPASRTAARSAIASRSDYGELTYRDWHPVGGDERDYDIPDPADPNIVYGSGLGGHITKWDARTGQVADITPWPEDTYGRSARRSRNITICG